MKGLINIYRHTFKTKGDICIIGDMHLNQEFFCYTLEDKLRANGVKVFGVTAIDAGEYDWQVTFSPRFKREMILIKNVPRFEGIRIHGGNTSEDSHGCPLVAFNTDYKRIWGTAEKELTRWAIREGGKGKIIISNNPFTYNRRTHKLEFDEDLPNFN